jgi:hypothetical protein
MLSKTGVAVQNDPGHRIRYHNSGVDESNRRYVGEVDLPERERMVDLDLTVTLIGVKIWNHS